MATLPTSSHGASSHGASEQGAPSRPTIDDVLMGRPDELPAYIQALHECGVPYVHPFTIIEDEMDHPPIQADPSNPPFSAEGSLVLAPRSTGPGEASRPRRPVLSTHPASEDFMQQVAIAGEVATRLNEHEMLFHIAQSATAKLLDLADLAGVDIEYAKALREEFDKMTPRLAAYYHKPLPSHFESENDEPGESVR